MARVKEEFNHIPDIKKELKYLAKHRIEIGIFGEDGSKLLMIAKVQEYGVEINVTEKMRSYLHYIDIHLRKDTNKISIPERSFMRGGFDGKKKKIQRQAEKVLTDVLMMKTRAKSAMEVVGQLIVTQLQSYMTSLSTPPNHPATVANKGSSNPLIDSGKLRQSISYKIRSN